MAGIKAAAGLALSCVWAWGQSPIVSPTVVPTFSYTMNSTALPANQTVKVTLPTAVASLPVIVENVVVPSTPCQPTVNPCGWLAVTPDQGHAPLTLTVSVNPTGLTPGSYPGSFQVDTIPTSGSPVTVTVTLQISNPPSTIMIGSASANYTAGASAFVGGSLAFQYTTADPAPTPISSELDISSSGDIIPFNVTVANAAGSGSSASGSTAAWLRVSSVSATQGQATTTSGSAGVGSLVPIFVTVDYATLQGLGIGQYYATITIAAVNAKVNGSISVTVTLVVSAGAPTVTAIFPQSLTPAAPTDPVFTIYGTNFTLNTSVFLDVYNNAATPGVPTSYQITTNRVTLVSPKVLLAKVPAADLPVASAGIIYPYLCDLRIQNGGFPAITTNFTVTDPSAPSISLIVNAGSYLPLSKFAGSGGDPAAAPNAQTAISPRGVISIFGQNLGPSQVSSAQPVTAVSPAPNYYDTAWDGMIVTVTYIDPALGLQMVNAPILMVSINQINAIVPKAVAAAAGTGNSQGTISVTNGVQTSAPYPVTILAEDPGIFTFGGLGQGQGAIINYDANGAATINSKTNAEPRGDVISLFATGLGELADATIPDGALTSATAAGVELADMANVKVTIAGQPAVVLYAGTSPGAVAGLVQVNAIVPPTATTGASIPITLSIGSKTVTRQAQTGVTLAVK